MKKRGIIFLLIGVIVAFLIAFFFLKSNKEEKISDFVADNKTELEEIAQDWLNGTTTVNECNGVAVEGVYSGKHQIVQFMYGGTGLVPSTTYYGFYYSEDDVPACFQNVDYELKSTSDNEWTWSDGTDNGGVTKRISECWFYYKAWF